MAESFESKSVKDTFKVARDVATRLKKKLKNQPCLILLVGDLGAGKTQWAKAFIETYLGRKVVVTSPTYSIVNAYRFKSRAVYHFDLYRLAGTDDLESVGFWDFIEKKNVCVVEWGDHLPPTWPDDLCVIRIEFDVIDEGRRQIRVNWLAA